ncbi:uncharacterized protein BYT42DRAFT_577442 [Radiomyces spectabilis]|uniref:uncharacterized protein n=1 Tax=Radiomyces spectabilis TaxID=64574 RepID=UPI0022200440|nr:uncharacterized protein BYT42DRAFT_577442 [Radiomyces spectabilis]KAI8374732.1 hypothetical protein BYT42DRAFT_577442 [Radiomyces spectabilis]
MTSLQPQYLERRHDRRLFSFHLLNIRAVNHEEGKKFVHGYIVMLKSNTRAYNILSIVHHRYIVNQGIVYQQPKTSAWFTYGDMVHTNVIVPAVRERYLKIQSLTCTIIDTAVWRKKKTECGKQFPRGKLFIALQERHSTFGTVRCSQSASNGQFSCCCALLPSL